MRMTRPFELTDLPDREWIELPGLFALEEIAPDDSLEIRACALLQRAGRVYYGVYVRDRVRGASRPAA